MLSAFVPISMRVFPAQHMVRIQNPGNLNRDPFLQNPLEFLIHVFDEFGNRINARKP